LKSSRFPKKIRAAQKKKTKGAPTAHPFELGASPQSPSILLTGKPGTTNIQNLQIALKMVDATLTSPDMEGQKWTTPTTKPPRS
jgi:hypothetical protein